MSLDKLTKLQNPGPGDAGGPRRLPTWLLPAGLALGFLLVFALLFGPRLLPALEVRTAPVVTLRQAVDQAATGPEATPVAADPANPSGPLLFQASGWIEPDPFTTYVPTLVDGVVDKVHVLEGETVKQDQLLATLIKEDAELDVQQAKRHIISLKARRTAHCAVIPVIEAELEAASKKIAAEQALLAELEDTASRLAAVTRGAVSEQDLTKAKQQVIRQQAKVSEAEAEIPRLKARLAQVGEEREAIDNEIAASEVDLARKELALSRTRITSPMDGIVLHLHAAPGKKRMLGMDDPKSAVIVELYDPKKIQARIDVPLNEAAGLVVGQPVRLTTDLLPDLSLAGSVTRITGEADISRNTLQTKVAILDPDPRLRPEMLVRAEFYPTRRDTKDEATPPTTTGRLALYAPKEALLNPGGANPQAWVIVDGRAELRQVTPGVSERDGHLLIRDGLRSGDQLILPPHDRLEPGKRVRPVTD